jgi:cytochrome b6-f complex iron-sulfur subunit
MGSIDDAVKGPHTRREFCARTGSALAFGAVMAACGGGGGGNPAGPSSFTNLPVANGNIANNGTAVQVTVDGASPLAAVGGVALVQSSIGNVLVAHTAQDTYVALSATCTHQACTITMWSSPNFVCPCHGSEFNTSGAVIRGPAGSSLPRLTTSLANDVLTISA